MLILLVLLLLESSERAGGNEPPRGAGAIGTPGAPYIGSPGDKGEPREQYKHCADTMPEMTTGVLSALYTRHGDGKGTMHVLFSAWST